MTRRGKCRCGTILQFRQTAQGYKTRCESCGAVVRLRPDAAARPFAGPKKTSSAVLAAAGVPPLPELPDQTDLSAPTLSLDDLAPPAPPDLSVFSEHESTAPTALAEMEVFRDPPPKPNRPSWLVFGLIAALVLAGVGVAAMVWG